MQIAKTGESWGFVRSGSPRIVACRIALAFAVFGLLFPQAVSASVSRIEVTHRVPVAGGMSFGATGPYELIMGRLHYGVDPEAHPNSRIVDLKLAPRDKTGRVTFAGDFILIKPLDLARGNGRLLYGVNNRGNLIMLNVFNSAGWTNVPLSAGDFGNSFLLERGYTLLWSGWNWDVVPGNGRLQIELPVATNEGQKITGPVAAEMVTTYPRPVLAVAWGGSRGYMPSALNSPEDRLTVRQDPEDTRRLIPRSEWKFLLGSGQPESYPVQVELEGGFEPDLIYELVYEAQNPRVVGLGLAAIRDALSFFRYAAFDESGTKNPLAGKEPRDAAGITSSIIYGFSQSARVIQHMLLQGFHLDESGKPVFDAAFIHGPGGGKGSFNHRFAQTTRHPSQAEDLLYPADFFPFATLQSRDPVTGKSASLLDAARRSGFVPKIFYLSSSTEYWTRAASLLHTDVQGLQDLSHDERVRIYAVAGAPHSVSLRPLRGRFVNCHNPLDYRPVARALLTALYDWMANGISPPPSRYPKLADSLLGTVAAYADQFPKIKGVRVTDRNLRSPRLDHGPRFATEGIADLQPPKRGRPFVTLVPLPDADGSDRGGIRLPAVAVPLGTYLGWNLRRLSSDHFRLGRWEGSFIPLQPTAALRRGARDPRRSIDERYRTKQDFLTATSAAARALVQQRFLLEQDVPLIVGNAERAFEALTGTTSRRTCEYLGRWRR